MTKQELAKRRQARYRAKHPGKASARAQAWKESNRERARANARRSAKKKYDAHPEAMRRRAAAWRSANKEKVKAMNAAWYAANPSAMRVKNATRRARKLKAGGNYTERDVRELFALQKGRCPVCHDELVEYHVDHVVPLALGGGNGRYNIQLLCPDCNIHKHAKHPVQFMQERGFLL